MASTYLERAASGSVTSTTTFTISTWLKKTANGVQMRWFNHENAASHTQKLDLHFLSTDGFRMGWWDGSTEYNLDSVRKFRDTNAWMHFVFRYDTTQATASDRVRVYVNGEQITLTNIGGGAATYPTQNKAMDLGQKKIVYGRYQASSPNYYWEGLMSHSHYCDGQSYGPETFGETDSTTGEWKIKTDVTATYGTNGHFILKDGNDVTDQSPNSNDFTVAGGTLTKSEDNPSNNFCIWNFLDNFYEQGSFTHAGATYQTGSSQYGRINASMGMNKGKFYWEVKPVANNVATDYYPCIGISSNIIRHHQHWCGYLSTDYSLQATQSGSILKMNNDTSTAWGTHYALNDIVGVAVDLDNLKIYFSKNGVWMESGDPTSGATGTGAAFTIADPATTELGFYLPSVSNYDGSGWVRFETNFGNGAFGNTQLTGTTYQANGLGIFKYEPPTGYTALCTKGLNK